MILPSMIHPFAVLISVPVPFLGDSVLWGDIDAPVLSSMVSRSLSFQHG